MQKPSYEDSLALLSATYAIHTERRAQDEKWGQQNHQFPKWLAILIEEVGEMTKAFLDAESNPLADGGNFRTEMVQSAAVLHAMIECGDRNGWFASNNLPYYVESAVTPVANPVAMPTIVAPEGPYILNTSDTRDDTVPF